MTDETRQDLITSAKQATFAKLKTLLPEPSLSNEQNG